MPYSLSHIGFLDEDDVVGTFAWTTDAHLRAHLARVGPDELQIIADALHYEFTAFAVELLETIEQLMEVVEADEQEEITVVTGVTVTTERIGEISWKPSDDATELLEDFARYNNNAYLLSMQGIIEFIVEFVGTYVKPFCSSNPVGPRCALSLLNVQFSDN
ncbi:MAG: hypothetical protein WBP12_04435 [Candidatus Saccharimonas sp.]